MADLRLPNGIDIPGDQVALPLQYRFYVLNGEDNGSETGLFVVLDTVSGEQQRPMQMVLAMPLGDAENLFANGLRSIEEIRNGNFQQGSS